MNGIGIRVTPEQLRQVAVQLNGAAGDIDGTLRQLAASVEPLGTDWAGVAQAHFLELWGDWQRGAAALHQALSVVRAHGAPATAHGPRRTGHSAGPWRSGPGGPAHVAGAHRAWAHRARSNAAPGRGARP